MTALNRLMTSKVLIAALALAISLGGTITAAPAEAGSPIVYNQSGKYVAGRHCAHSSCGVYEWMPNSQHFYMRCWMDNQYYYGNYGSARWFGGYSQSGYWMWVHSSYVYYQTSVPRC